MTQNSHGAANDKPANDNINDNDVIVPGGGNVLGYFQLKTPQNGSGLLTADIGAQSPGNASSRELKVLCLDGYNTPTTKENILATGTSCLSAVNRGKPSFTEKGVSLGAKPIGKYFTIHAAVVWSDGTSEKLGFDSGITS